MPGYHIRLIADYAEMKRAVDFQRVIWGQHFSELVPAAVFWFGNRIGSILAGAFEDDDTMIGLLFGVTGIDAEGTPLHWSDMLGVHPAARGRGVGIALKRFQRNTLLERGVTTVNWTFDPLESRNAWINFSRLGIIAREYIRDCYGASTSPLHRGIGTDRLVAHWQLDSERVRSRMEGPGKPSPSTEGLTVLNSGGAAGPEGGEPRVLVRIPADIQGLKERDEVSARRWRDQTRRVFEQAFAAGYRAVELVRLDEATSAYVLERDASA